MFVPTAFESWLRSSHRYLGFSSLGLFRAYNHCLLLLVLLSAIAALSSPAFCGGGPRDVLVVVNGRSTLSVDIGTYYVQARGIPWKNLCYIFCSTNEFVSKTECENKIRNPIRKYIQRAGLQGKIDYIVLTKGIPLGAYYQDGEGAYSVASVLTCLDLPEVQGPIVNPYGPTAKGAYGVPAPERNWSHNLAFNGSQYYLVTRLDAFTPDQVKNLIYRSVKPASNGRFLLDKIPYAADYYYYANNRLGIGPGSAYDKLKIAGMDVICDTTASFISGQSDLMGYFSWGSNDPDYAFSKFMSNSFTPGSIADMYYSFSARTFIRSSATPPDKQPDSLLGYMIENGLCGAGGYVSEPIITTATFPHYLFDRYVKGYNLAESFYMACPQLFWKTVIIGDPLMSVYATSPQVSMSGVDKPLTGTVPIEVNAVDQSGVNKVELFIDGALLETSTQVPFISNLDTTRYRVGYHTIEAVAYENSPVHTQGFAKCEVRILNDIPSDAHISQAVAFDDGKELFFTGKLVVAGTDIVSQGFYVEETDRAFGLKVVWDGEVAAGDLINVAGRVSTVDGERCLVADNVDIASSGNDLPRPLYMPIKYVGGAAFDVLTPGTLKGLGLRNLGIIVKVVGTVSSYEAGYMILRSGKSGLGLRIKIPQEVGSPPVGELIAVTGVVAGLNLPEGLVPVILLQDSKSLQIVTP